MTDRPGTMRSGGLQALAASVEPWCSEPGDTEDARSRKTVFAVAFLLILPASLVWGSLYVVLGAYRAAALPFLYFALAAASFVVFRGTRRFRPFQVSQCGLILGVSFVLQLALGGYVGGSAVVAWCFLAPLMAVLVVGLREALVWFGLFLAALTIAALLQNGLQPDNPLPAWAINAFFVLNLGGPAIVAFAMLFSFVKAKEELRTLERSYLQQEVMLRQQDKLATLGTLSAGMAHELNNPAAAVSRNADQLELVLTQLEDACLAASATSLTPEQTEILRSLCSGGSPPPSEGSSMGRALLEGELEAWLEGAHVDRGWELAPILAEHGYSPAVLERRLEVFSPTQRPAVCTMLARSLAARGLAAGLGDGAARISDIVSALKSYTYLDRGEGQSVDVTEGLESTLVLRHPKLADMRVERDYAPDLPRLWVHGSELNQVWTNIIDNAIDATGGTGTIILRTRQESNRVIVEIEDDGPGMPAQVAAQAFDPFFTTKEPGMGTGLGLNISHNIIVTQHGGTISVDSSPGRTCFRVELPSAPSAATAPG